MSEASESPPPQSRPPAPVPGFNWGNAAEIVVAMLFVAAVLAVGVRFAGSEPERVAIGRAGPAPAVTAPRLPAVAAAAVPAPQQVTPGAPLPPNPSTIDIAFLDGRIRQLMNRKDMVGLGVVVVEDGAVRYLKGFGSTGGEGEPGSGAVTPNTVFRWASVSKGVAATMVAKLAEEGKLSLSDPVSRWSSSLKLPGDDQNVATVTQLLSQRLGIVKNAYDDKLEDNEDPRAIRTMLGGLDRFCRPGQCWTYQNVAYDAASEVVQKATGVDYGDAVRQSLFLPLGMKSASTTREGLVSARSWARPHIGQRTLEVKEAYYRVPAAGGVNSSIADLGRWMQAQMGMRNDVLDEQLLWTIHLPRIETARRSRAQADVAMEDGRYALGWRNHVYRGHRLVGHRGAVSGYRSLILFDPALRTGIAMLWNSQSPKPPGLPLELFDMVYKLPRHDWMDLAG
ncbi:serine hydrolase [Sphingomonas naphthae]|uniref:Serine hydrolase n=1 Tax=Sphingomonas naphthae TaxID=1813468 RepID=A0ABY7TNK8_9SPHN|nr:serine hydrolase domain-containing protein [Sphingomonas naphthae]WCT74822.1 serine hydrolase [Sphingomonas naphthae]